MDLRDDRDDRRYAASGRLLGLLLTIAGLSVSAAAAAPDDRATTDDGGGLPVVEPEQLTADYWIARAPQSERVLLTPAEVTVHNARVVAAGPGLHDLSRLPDRLPRAVVVAHVRARAESTTARPEPRADAAAPPDTAAWLALDDVPDDVVPRFALAVRRADMRTFPTDLPGRTSAADSDIDRFQESALFPGTPVAIVHASRDGRWAFVIAPHYAAWVARDALATADRDTVLAVAAAASRVVTGATVRTVAAPDRPAVVLDMGVALPEEPDWPLDQSVDGQGTLGAVVVRLPDRAADGGLVLRPTLIPRSADTRHGPLPASRAALLRQAFKFLGERYCWGHGGGGRDCSGFVGECYRSLGLVLPRNSGDQAACTASFRRTVVPADADHATRLAALARLEPGDLVHVPGHVMLVIGADERGTWVIHDSHSAVVRSPDGGLVRMPTNSVVVCPLEPLLRDDGTSLVDAITVLQHYLPPSVGR